MDQSTQGTKALLFDETGRLMNRADLPHRQITNESGWVEHDPEEIWQNTLQVIKNVTAKAGIDKNDIAAMGISNQRETTVCWERATGKPVCNAIVWQCARAAELCETIEKAGYGKTVRQKTGIPLSPYFPAAKLAWVLRNVPGTAEKAAAGEIAAGTVDSWLVWKLTGGQRHQTDYSNASRTQLFNLKTLKWDPELLAIFRIPSGCMAEITDSDGDYGETDLEGWLNRPIPIRGVLGDSHAALFGQGCLKPGMVKATYGTGSSIMMNVGNKPVTSDSGVVTSLAWKLRGEVNYVLEGNINYTGAVITWLKNDLKLIASPGETEELARAAVPEDLTYLVPAFSGLGAPYWDSNARACLCGMSRTTGKNEVVRAALDCIAYQIADIVTAMRESAKTPIGELRVDGGPTRNAYLMQFQSDLLGIPVLIPDQEELSGIGAAWAAGLAVGILDDSVFDRLKRTAYTPLMGEKTRAEKTAGWHEAVRMIQHR
uniref:ATP:glycerol 3-phosphotransferase n=1 Tax=uncultured bacterium Contig1756 TaxID=1393499 RepID=W0FH30_9BACT|nr:carbohydrate kinase, FGGY-like protein [uncultured bacterium Contig1756]